MSENKAFKGGAAWSGVDVDLAIQMLKDRVPLKEMCQRLGRTASSVIGKLEKEGRIVVMADGHYYIVPEAPCFMWQEVKEADAFMSDL